MTPDLSRAGWRKSTWSGAGGDCVEVAFVADTTAVRDTKAHGAGPVLLFDHPAWAAFLADVKHGTFSA